MTYKLNVKNCESVPEYFLIVLIENENCDNTHLLDLKGNCFNLIVKELRVFLILKIHFIFQMILINSIALVFCVYESIYISLGLFVSSFYLIFLY